MGRNKQWVLGLGLVGLLAVPLVAQSALLLRTIDGVDLYYDDVLDITWHGNANLAATETFGLTQSTNVFPAAGEVGSTGRMNWFTANAWIAGMNTANYLGFNDWRLPILSPIDGTSVFNNDFSNNATTDRGNADADGWVDGSGTPVSEMGHMFYVNLGNLGFCTPNDSSPGSCVEQTGFGLVNTGPFSNVQTISYWSGTELSASNAWLFSFNNGLQDFNVKGVSLFAWAVRSGDVSAAAVPAPGVLGLFGIGLLGLLGAVRKRR